MTRQKLAIRIVSTGFAVITGVLGVTALWLDSPQGLEWARQKLVRAGNGTIEVENARGSLLGEVQIDRARALVALKREAEAGEALVEARTSAAANPLAWLLSATLSRRQGKLAQAQAQIATAAELAPHDAEVGLEAGVIAMLTGNEAAARKSWQSAIAAAPASEAAATAKGYLAQLGEAPQSKP